MNVLTLDFEDDTKVRIVLTLVYPELNANLFFIFSNKTEQDEIDG